MVIVITIITTITIFTLLLVLLRRIRPGDPAVNQRLNAYVNPSVLQTNTDEYRSPASSPVREMIRRLGRKLATPKWSRSVEHKLTQAGMPLRTPEFMVICLCTTFAFAALLYTLSHENMTVGFVGGLTGYLIPIMVLEIRIGRRKKAISEQLADALMLIANSLRTGYSFLQAVELTAREMRPPISMEFGRMLKEMNLGVTTENAMDNLARRVNNDDLDLVVTAVLIQRQIGGNLAEILENISATIRERVKIKGEIKTLTAQGRVSGLIIGLLPIVMAIIIQIINPEYVRTLYVTDVGRLMLLGAAASEVFGVLVIRRIVNIEV